MKLLSLGDIEEKENIKVDGILLPLENFAVSTIKKYTISDIEEIARKNLYKEIFIIINKNIFNSDLNELKKVLKELDEIPITGIFFYDVTVLYLAKKLGIKKTLVWNQNYMVTNYKTINYYAKKNVNGAVLSSEITLEEMLEIRKNTNSKLFITVLAKPIMSFSRRHLLTNYYKYSNIDSSNTNLEIREQKSNIPYEVQEENSGTSIISSTFLNITSVIPTLKENNIDYIIADVSSLDVTLQKEVITNLNEIITNNSQSAIERIEDLIGNNTGFLNKKTIYQVKRDE